VIHDGMQCDSIQSQGHEPLKSGNPAVFKSYLQCCTAIYNVLWQL